MEDSRLPVRSQDTLHRREIDGILGTADNTHTHEAAQARAYRVPSPPRIVVPPPITCGPGAEDIHLIPYAASDYLTQDFRTLEILGKVSYHNMFMANNCLDWTYESRRVAQEILPYLYLGPVSAAKDLDFLKDNQITLIFAVRNKSSAHAKLLDGTKTANKLNIQFASLDVANNQELIAGFPSAINTISSHMLAMRDQPRYPRSDPSTGQINTPGKVLVYCESGNERSAALVIAYILAIYDVEPIKTIQLVQSQRFSVNLNDALKRMVVIYAEILQARRRGPASQVSQASPSVVSSFDAGHQPRASPQNSPSHNVSKRKLDGMNNSDIDMIDASGQMSGEDGHQASRDGSAPFADP